MVWASLCTAAARSGRSSRSAQRRSFVYTHRSGKWSTFYSEGAKAAQLAFSVRQEASWPLERTDWRPLYLGADGALATGVAERADQITFSSRRNAAAFTFIASEDLELTGPMSARLWVQVHGADDVHLFVGVEKWRGGRHVNFEGSFGYGRDRVSTGWQKASQRELDESRSKIGEPVHTFLNPQP